MKWIKNNTVQQVITIEGYKLRVELVSKNKFSWLIYKDGQLLYSSLRDKRYTDNINKAKKLAVQRMTCHLKKLIG